MSNSRHKCLYALKLPKRYGVVILNEPGAAAIAARACIDIWGEAGIVTRVVVTPAKRRSRR